MLVGTCAWMLMGIQSVVRASATSRTFRMRRIVARLAVGDAFRMQFDYWSELSISTRRALQWASAMARFRAVEQGDDAEKAAVDSHDFLVGMVLSHPHDAEAVILLKHFGFNLGHVFPSNYRRPAPENLEHHLKGVSGSRMPSICQDDAQPIIEDGMSLRAHSSSKEVAELRLFFAALLSTTNRAAESIRGLLARRGVHLTDVASTTRDYLQMDAEPSVYADLLEKSHPYSSQPLNIPNYKADHEQTADPSQDLINIRAEVDAFAYLLASCDLKPPLAVGLFGDWGSGKSFFMEAVRQRIDELISSPELEKQPQSVVPFWKRIVQIRFNAWHYVEGELWASLVDHIFSQLRLVYDREDSVVEARRKYWLDRLGSARLQLARLESKRTQAESELQKTQREAERLRDQRDVELSRMEQLKTLRVTGTLLDDASLQLVNAAVKQLCLAANEKAPAAALETLNEARREVRRASTVLGELLSRPTNLALVLATLVGVPWLVSWLSQSTSELASAFAGFSVVAATGGRLIHNGTGWLNQRLQKIAEAERKVKQNLEAEREVWAQKIEAANEAALKAERSLTEVLARETRLTDELKSVQAQLENVSPIAVLSEFVTERSSSGDYRKLLGVPALIQTDFQQLSQLISEQNRELRKPGASAVTSDPNHFNRIILYIDDLDRCPEERVVKVLQAVHLLLAFDLFVVVVAVDSRWLNHALVRQLPALTGYTTDGNHATPADYLEKIFQVPFSIDPLDETATRSIVRGLLRGHIALPEVSPPDGPGVDKFELDEAQREVLDSLASGNVPPALDATALTITQEESRFLDELSPLLGATPRSVKRFVNLYQLLRIMERREVGEDASETPSVDNLIAWTLAVGNGLQDFGLSVMQQLRSQPSDQSLENVISALPPLAGTERERQLLTGWLDKHAEWKQMPIARLKPLVPSVDRFLFRLGEGSSRL